MLRPKKRYRILLVDDHPALRESIAAAVRDFRPDQLEVAGQCGDGVAALELVKRHKPDLVVLDLGLPRLGGVQAIPEIKKLVPGIVVLVFSMYDDQAHVVEAIRAGADDYLFKQDATPAVVVDHILRSLESRLEVQDKLHRRLFTALRQAEGDRLSTGLPRLTGAELEVLKRAAYQGLSMKEIARELGGAGGPLSELTVRKHFENIYEKLGAQSQSHAVCLAIKFGILSSDPAEPAAR